MNKQLEACKAANKDADHSHRSGQKMSERLPVKELREFLNYFGDEVAISVDVSGHKAGMHIACANLTDCELREDWVPQLIIQVMDKP